MAPTASMQSTDRAVSSDHREATSVPEMGRAPWEGLHVNVIEVTGGRKTYQRWRKPPELALNGLDLTVGEGGVHGFLGPNGSGKTTTIRALLGLVHVDGGEFRLFGQPVPERLPDLIGGVGALVETPIFFPAFSGRL